MVAYLSKIFGLRRLDLAEDVVQDTLLKALETWPDHGIPENPSAWLMRVARNRAIDVLRRDDQLRYFTPELVEFLQPRENPRDPATDFEKEIQDDQLRMMFSCCHPDLSTDAQVTLILKTLCGFSVSEIAYSLLTSQDSIEKRLGRARKVLRDSGTLVEIDKASDVSERLEAVYQAIYLLFNEGYHGSEQTVREDLCFEAIRLALLLSEHPEGNKPKTNALIALLCFQAARLESRIGDDGGLIQLDAQDRSKWNHELIAKGFDFLRRSSAGNEVSDYHLQAAIASLHCAAPTYEQTDWPKILDLYNTLYQLKPSPIVALNRAVAVAMAEGIPRGLALIDDLARRRDLDGYHLLHAARADLLRRLGSREEAAREYKRAIRLVGNDSERRFLERRLREVQS